MSEIILDDISLSLDSEGNLCIQNLTYDTFVHIGPNVCITDVADAMVELANGAP